jgi:hypothetical protein
MKSNLLKLILACSIIYNAQAGLLIGLLSPTAGTVVATIGLASGGGIIFLTRKGSSEERSIGELYGLLGIIGGIILDNKLEKVVLTKEFLGIDPGPLAGMNINMKLSANQLYQDLQWQRDARNADISDEKLAFYADHLNGNAIRTLLNSKLDEL